MQKDWWSPEIEEAMDRRIAEMGPVPEKIVDSVAQFIRNTRASVALQQAS